MGIFWNTKIVFQLHVNTKWFFSYLRIRTSKYIVEGQQGHWWQHSRKLLRRCKKQVHIGLFHLHSRYLAQILVQSHFELVSLVLALEATELVSEPLTQMAVELINNHLILVQQKR